MSINSASLSETDVHPLEGLDPKDCYDAMMAERSALITAKRSSEDDLIKSLIQLSSAALLIIPGALLTSQIKLSNISNVFLALGSLSFVMTLVAALAEQRFSSWAYDEQVKVIKEYYDRKSLITEHVKSAKWVKRASITAFILFVSGLILSVIGLAISGMGNTMSQEPRPRPEPVHIPDHKTDVPTRSVPPSAPPPPPPPKKG